MRPRHRAGHDREHQHDREFERVALERPRARRAPVTTDDGHEGEDEHRREHDAAHDLVPRRRRQRRPFHQQRRAGFKPGEETVDRLHVEGRHHTAEERLDAVPVPVDIDLEPEHRHRQQYCSDDRGGAAGDHAPASAQQHVESEQHQRKLEQGAQAEQQPGRVFVARAPEQQGEDQQQQDEVRRVAFTEAVHQRTAGEDRQRQHRPARDVEVAEPQQQRIDDGDRHHAEREEGPARRRLAEQRERDKQPGQDRKIDETDRGGLGGFPGRDRAFGQQPVGGREVGFVEVAEQVGRLRHRPEDRLRGDAERRDRQPRPDAALRPKQGRTCGSHVQSYLIKSARESATR